MPLTDTAEGSDDDQSDLVLHESCAQGQYAEREDSEDERGF